MTQEMTREQMLALLKQMQDENNALKVLAEHAGNGLKVSEKGAVSVYGVGRFPVTLYRSQWEALFTRVDAIKAFIIANADKLSTSADKTLAKG